MFPLTLYDCFIEVAAKLDDVEAFEAGPATKLVVRGKNINSNFLSEPLFSWSIHCRLCAK